MDSNASPTDFLESLRNAKEDASVRNVIEIRRWLAILDILLPAALNSAAAGNLTMRQAVQDIWPLLPKPK